MFRLTVLELRIAYVADHAREAADFRYQVRMDSRSLVEMSSQYLGGDAVSTTLLGRSTSWHR